MSVTFLVVGGGLLKQNLALRAVFSTIFQSIEGKLGTEMYFAIEKCREMQLKMQRFATHLIPFRQCVGQSIALAMKRDDMGVMN